MKIYDRNLTGTSASETGRTQETQKAGNTGSGKSVSGLDGSSDRVEFSGTMGQLSRAVATFESTRADRLQTLAAAYQSGTYRSDSLATSKGMVAEAMGAGLQ